MYVSNAAVQLCVCAVVRSESSMPRTDQSDNEALTEPSLSENAPRTDKPPSRRRSASFSSFLLLTLSLTFDLCVSKYV